LLTYYPVSRTAEWLDVRARRYLEATATTVATAPRDHTISFRLRDEHGNFRSNVVWLIPDWLGSLTVGDVEFLVNRANGKRK